ncbi:MAG: hypothetical protein IH903_09610 [Proteobacteria bacterium]|nr:hypothetical protein [Pseudomonadota bacterium]
MDKKEARVVLAEHLARYRTRPYAELEKLLGDAEAYETDGPSGVTYQLTFQTYLDGKESDDLRVLGTIDDGGWRWFSPLVDNFIMRRDGSFVDE